MRRRISLLLAATLAGTALTLFGATPPVAAVVVCAGQGAMTVNPGLLYPTLLGVGATSNGKDHFLDVLVFDPIHLSHGIALRLAVGGCVHVRTPPTISEATGTGALLGFCGHAAGSGTIAMQPFAYVTVGPLFVLTGHLFGMMTAVPVPILTGSCLHVEGPIPTTPFALPSGANEFIVSGAGVGLNCSNPLPMFETLVTLSPVTALPMSTVGVHVAPHAANVSIMLPCVPGLLQ